MKNRANGQTVERKKVAAIGLLSLASVAITVLGVAVCVSSLRHNIVYSTMITNIPGAAFGLVIAFLGMRYFWSVQKLKAEVYKETSKFSWGNFKKENRK